MFTVIVLLIILVSIMLSAVVLAQSSKGDGLSGTLGAPGAMGSVFGVRRASDFLVKATITLAGVFIFLAMIANIFFLPNTKESPSAIQGGVVSVPSAPVSPAPMRSAPAVSQPAGGQPGTGATNPESDPGVPVK